MPSLDPGVKPGGEGKADTDGVVDVDDLFCETTRTPLSSGLEHELDELQELKAGDRDNSEGPAAPFVESAGGVSPDSAGPRRVSLGDGRGGTNQGESRVTTPVSSSS